MNKQKNKQENKFNEWLAGLIDGDGYFGLSKKGYASLEITIDRRDETCLHKIKNIFGGSIKPIAGLKAIRYRLHNKEGLLKIIEAVNGQIRNPTRLAQLFKICEKYKIQLIYANNITYHNGWLSGFIDSDGSVYYNTKSIQIYITISQRNKLLLDLLVPIYGGKVFAVKSNENFKWMIWNKSEILDFIEYFNIYPLYSAKMNRIRLIPIVYECFKKSMQNSDITTIEGKYWKKIEDKWETYETNSEMVHP